MHDDLSRIREKSFQGDQDMSLTVDFAEEALAAEAERMVKDAAQPVRSGTQVSDQIRAAERALKYDEQERWRVRSAWYGEAGTWTAAAYWTLIHRYQSWRDRVERRAHAAAELERTRLHALRQDLATARAGDPSKTSIETGIPRRIVGGGDRGT